MKQVGYTHNFSALVSTHAHYFANILNKVYTTFAYADKSNDKKNFDVYENGFTTLSHCTKKHSEQRSFERHLNHRSTFCGSLDYFFHTGRWTEGNM